MKNKEILIVPDVHGRDFWKVVKEYPNSPIVFLGDYVAPYEDYDGISKREAIEMFKEVLKFRKENPERVTLLLGNHDASYIIGADMCRNRIDYENYDEIRKLFWDKDNEFQFTLAKEINGKKFLFSHAGYTKDWIKCANEIFLTEDLDKIFSDWQFINRMDKTHSYLLYKNLKKFSFYRDGYDLSGSLIWADVQEHIKTDVEIETDWIQIFAHTYCKLPLHGKSEYEWYMLDCKEVFYIDQDGIVRYLKDDKEIEMIKIN